MKTALEGTSPNLEISKNLRENLLETSNQGDLLRGIVNCSVTVRALPDFTSGLEVQQIFKIRTVQNPDVFLPGRRTFNTFENRKISKHIFSKIFFPIFFFQFFGPKYQHKNLTNSALEFEKGQITK